MLNQPRQLNQSCFTQDNCNLNANEISAQNNNKLLPHELFRKRQRERIAHENQKMVERMYNQKACVDFYSMHVQEKRRQQLLKLIQVLPSSQPDNQSRQVASAVSQYQSNKSLKQHYESGKSLSEFESNNKEKAGSMGVFLNFNQRPYELDYERLVVYKKGKIVSKSYYIVELSYNARAFFVCLFSIENESHKVVLELDNQKKTQEILTSFDHNYEALVSHIRVIKGRIKIMRPQQLQSETESENANESKMLSGQKPSKLRLALNSSNFSKKSTSQSNCSRQNIMERHSKSEMQVKTNRSSQYQNLLKQSKNSRDNMLKKNESSNEYSGYRNLDQERSKSKAQTPLNYNVKAITSYRGKSHNQVSIPRLPSSNIQEFLKEEAQSSEENQSKQSYYTTNTSNKKQNQIPSNIGNTKSKQQIIKPMNKIQNLKGKGPIKSTTKSPVQQHSRGIGIRVIPESPEDQITTPQLGSLKMQTQGGRQTETYSEDFNNSDKEEDYEQEKFEDDYQSDQINEEIECNVDLESR